MEITISRDKMIKPQAAFSPFTNELYMITTDVLTLCEFLPFSVFSYTEILLKQLYS